MKIVNLLLLPVLVFVSTTLSAQQDIILNVNQPPLFNVSAGKLDTTILSGETIQLGFNLDVSGGSGDYFYNWSGGTSISDDISDSPEVSPIETTVYSCTIVDGNGCSSEVQYTVTVISPLGIAATVINTSCSDGNDGSVAVEITSGTPPYNISWSTGITGETELTGLAAGEYMITISDDAGQTFRDTLEVTSPEPLETEIQFRDTVVNNENTILIDAATTGGTSPYSYEWPNGITTQDVVVSDTVTVYSVTVTDANGCTNAITFDVTNSNLTTENGGLNLNIYPNPNSGKFKYNVKSDSRGPLNILITNVEGKLVMQKEIQSFAGYYSGEIDLPNVSGAYHFTVKSAANIVTRSFVIR